MQKPSVVVGADADTADDSPRDACGIFGLRAPDQPVAHLTYLGLYALQHRGQESAGMAVGDGDTVMVVKDMGLVSHVFDDRTLAPLTGHVAIGHNRYSAGGPNTWRAAQPVFRAVGDHQFALGHNGNLVNTDELVAEAGMLEGTIDSDSDLIAELLAQEHDRGRAAGEATPTLPDLIEGVIPRLRGAFSLVFMDEDQVIGLRDPNGFRPLCLGRLDPGGWVIASESPALDVIGAQFVRELEPGEMVVIDADGVHSRMLFPPERIEPKLCLFEFSYISRPDTRLYGRSVYHARLRQGELLAEQAPVEADMVIGVPESGIPSAVGYARASGIIYGQGLVKNRYIGRTFIAPSQELRAQGVRIKFNPLRENLRGQRVVVVDDSIVRGTTQRQLVRMLRESGVEEVHLRLTSPPIAWPCFFGIDTGSRADLLAANLSVDEIRAYLDLDSIGFITLEHLVESTETDASAFCTACFTGEYPIDVPTMAEHEKGAP